MCNKVCAIIAISLIILGILFLVAPNIVDITPQNIEAERRTELNARLKTFLESKESPLAKEVEFITGLEHWRLLIAISAIESRFCKRQAWHNCWGVGGDRTLRRYSSFRSAAQDANDLIVYWQSRGRWLTVEDMNCHYVYPCNPNWVKVVNQNLQLLNEL